MKMKKSLMAILTATMMMLSFLGPVLYIQIVQGADPTNWYKSVDGVLDTDTYLLYPYEAKSLTVGFSQFGEMIDGSTKSGIIYGTTDPFAPDTASPPEWQWIEGWILNITYVQGGRYKNVWAMATYSDYQDSLGIGGNWTQGVTVGSTDLSVRGGRKTSGGAVTDPIRVLYDGPRRYVALCKTTIYDSAAHDTGLVSLTFTIDFNKVKKQVVVYKDVKRIDIGKNIGDMQIEFGDRGEWDLGAGSPPKSYARFYTGNTTVYDANWQPWYNTTATAPSPDGTAYNGTYDVCQIVDDELNYVGWAAFWPKPIVHWVGATQEEADRDTILTSMVTITETQIGTGSKDSFTIAQGTPSLYPQQNSSGIYWVEDPMVFVNDVHKIINSSDTAKMVYYFTGNNTVKFPTGYVPHDGDNVTIVYKDSTRSKSEMSSEPNSPFVIGEWAFEMSETPSQFRGVTVYGITDRNDGDDANRLGTDVFDREVGYQLNEVFNPWDLYKAINKDTDRWVEYKAIGYTGWVSDRVPVLNVSDDNWDRYCTFSERVEDLNTSALVPRSDYTFTVDDDGYGHITGLLSSHYYKITYSTDTGYSQAAFSLTNTVVNQTAANLTTGIDWGGDIGDSWTDPLGVSHGVNAEEFTFDVLNTNTSLLLALSGQNLTWTYTGPTLEWEVEPFKVFKEDVANLEVGSDSYENVSVAAATNASLLLAFHIQYLEINWAIAPPTGTLFTDYKDVHFYGWDNDVNTAITVTYSNITGNFTFSATLSFVNDVEQRPLYTEYTPGRYEWGVVGTNAASVDSAGLSLVSAAFKNKQVEYGIAGEDMFASTEGGLAVNQMPWVMAKIGSGNTWADYYYDNTGGDYRTGLRDDWCTTWPITTSNMIGVGGPLANMLAYYGNDFTDAFYGLDQFTPDTMWKNKIAPLSCWNKTHGNYVSTNSTGYAVIGTYKDINGTVLFLIWGNWGRDTYYVTKWFHEEGILQLQQAPHGLTSIVVKIDYSSYPEGYKPTGFTIVECLGTISERLWLHGSETKGGIHDP
jgi:hypothetical protein